MDLNNVANSAPTSPRIRSTSDELKKGEKIVLDMVSAEAETCSKDNLLSFDVSPKTVENEKKSQEDRVLQCRKMLDSIKTEMQQYKNDKIIETKYIFDPPIEESYFSDIDDDFTIANNYNDLAVTSSVVSASIDSNLKCDENLMAYEMQLEKYQNTLKMAQIEKKNAIRKKMLAKAYKLKLMEVKNQIKMELLRVKQSLQCLEPLRMVANTWKMSENTDSCYALNNYNILPRAPELSSYSEREINSLNIEETIHNNVLDIENNFPPAVKTEEDR